MHALTIAVGDYGITENLKAGKLESDRLILEQIRVDPIVGAMRRMVRGLEFDICEMAISTYLCARAHGKPVTAIPVFLTRNFHHRAIFHNVESGITEPKDLEGRTVGVNRGYTVTTGLWARGILQTEYGVNLDNVNWAATDDEHVAEYRPPPNVSYALQGEAITALLASGQLDAAVGDIRTDSAVIQSLIPDPFEAGVAYYRKTGVYPLNHTVVIKNAVLEEAPWVAEELFLAFEASKDAYLARLDAGGDLSAADHAAVGLRDAVGGDPFPFGVAANRKALDAVIQFAADQRVIADKPDADDLFAPATLKLA